MSAVHRGSFENNSPNPDKPEPKRVLSPRRKDAKIFFLAFLAALREIFLLNVQGLNC